MSYTNPSIITYTSGKSQLTTIKTNLLDTPNNTTRRIYEPPIKTKKFYKRQHQNKSPTIIYRNATVIRHKACNTKNEQPESTAHKKSSTTNQNTIYIEHPFVPYPALTRIATKRRKPNNQHQLIIRL